ncbi:hypothetical protein TNCV_4659121 [Trichonephila clavipes]|nr:hypothetical protein TNCV_4659121 [Trichonephila clavipes]
MPRTLGCPQWRNGEHLGPPAKSGFEPPKLDFTKGLLGDSQAVGPLEPWAPRNAGVAGVYVTPLNVRTHERTLSPLCATLLTTPTSLGAPQHLKKLVVVCSLE